MNLHSDDWCWHTDRHREHTELKADRVGPQETPSDTRCYITAPGSVSGSLEGGTRAGRGLINECYWVVESLCPHSPSCHWHSQWLHQFVAIITSKDKNGEKRGVKDCVWGGGQRASVAPSVDSWTLRSDHWGHLLCMYIKLNVAKGLLQTSKQSYKTKFSLILFSPLVSLKFFTI